MKAVHFGAGNIGRGFVGLILHKAGYEVVFADVATDLIDSLATTPSYQVHEVGRNSRSWTVDNYRAINSATHESDVVAEIATAEIVTTAVGASILRFVAPVIARALDARSPELPPLQIMACENAINATDILRAEIAAQVDERVLAKAIFANTAVDRIVPAQEAGSGLDVTVEEFFEWAVERPPFGGQEPVIPDVHFVDDLRPYIERKLFTVNTGHATLAYHGYLRGAATLADAMELPEVLAEVQAVLLETTAMLVARHGFDRGLHDAYVQQCLVRFSNPHLPDTPERVARSPLRKLGRNERFIHPAAELAGLGQRPVALLRAIGAALRFDLPSDPESVRMAGLLVELTPDAFTTEVTGLTPGDALYPDVVDTVRSALAAQR
ncbi:MAG: mannitol-phosphate 5-dehydrogenase [Microbacteriaceae bacterium]|nr:mannitol-phosphate 5-dehydrogenase [Microbacteriaceae bacterium]